MHIMYRRGVDFRSRGSQLPSNEDLVHEARLLHELLELRSVLDGILICDYVVHADFLQTLGAVAGRGHENLDDIVCRDGLPNDVLAQCLDLVGIALLRASAFTSVFSRFCRVRRFLVPLRGILWAGPAQRFVPIQI